MRRVSKGGGSGRVMMGIMRLSREVERCRGAVLTLVSIPSRFLSECVGLTMVVALTSDTIDEGEASTSVLPPRTSPVAPHRARKLRRESASTPSPPLQPPYTGSSLIPGSSTLPQSTRSSSVPISHRDVTQGDKSRDKGGWSPPWKSRRKSLDTRD